MSHSANDELAWVCGQWQSMAGAVLAHDDLGILQGATIVERLRTADGKVLDLQLHLDRLHAGLEHLAIRLPLEWDCGEIIERCAVRNLTQANRDMSIVVVATPGRAGATTPSLIVHAAAIPWKRLRSWYRDGQRLSIATSRNVPSVCWPVGIKTRSRLHYYLADCEAQKAALENSYSGANYAGGILPDLDGHLTETSTANILLVEAGRLVCPPLETILHGVSLRRTLRLAESKQVAVEYAPVTTDRALAADGILLCGSVGCLWAAASLNDQVFAPPEELAVYRTLRDGWCEDIGIDYIGQAITQPGS